ncbi:phosphoglycerate mutase family protein [Aquimarina spongiae]|uniref:Histidine phosphatase superfamily (Branch 1) n=1 Tax=Aquimarina spongiae TaxID=570521 RepID=A0A1M6G4E4_9FLAO|nr:phosphoglycerate mutase family protein [Aquimarina spongiae]SHJ04881.1 Histidine phosphatase superfamily (branch 1) [Aquimarina spongiae]
MRFTLSLLVFLLSFSAIAQKSDTAETTTYYFIRHAEKELSDPNNRDPELTKEGKERAQNWAKVLADVKIDFVFSSDFIRTRHTAEPIIKAQNAPLLIYDHKKLNEPEFQEKTKGKTSVIVGHSNSTPTFVNTILGTKKYDKIDEKVYGKLFIVTLKNDEIVDHMLTIN